ncbi:MAG: dihydroorotase [Muribaculaceae bacterium]|nr:dihydroorotase [Muribaculaceae bacterium]
MSTQSHTRQLLVNADIEGRGQGWVAIDGQRIAATGMGEAPEEWQRDARVTDLGGDLLMPGAIDVHVHFRDPGLTHKADFATESRAAVAGGVTSVVDMPNTVPQTTTVELLRQKAEMAAGKSVANYGFFIGATNDNLAELQAVDPSTVAGVKLFVGSSTGNMLVDDADALDHLFATVKMPISVHAEDEAVIARCKTEAIARYGSADKVPVAEHSNIRPVEACVRATERVLRLAERHGAHVHIAHLTTAREVEMVAEARRGGARVTCEVSPHHLTFCTDDYERLGTRIKMNPAVKSADDREALRKALAVGTIDMVATDHAPHLLKEKEGGALTAVSGAPMVQFSLPVVLSLFGPEVAAEKMSHRPAEVFGIRDRGRIEPGCYADLVRVRRLAEPHTVADAEVVSKCGWTPLAGTRLDYAVVTTWVNGRVYEPGAGPGSAMALEFSH